MFSHRGKRINNIFDLFFFFPQFLDLEKFAYFLFENIIQASGNLSLNRQTEKKTDVHQTSGLFSVEWEHF